MFSLEFMVWLSACQEINLKKEIMDDWKPPSLKKMVLSWEGMRNNFYRPH